MSMLRPSLPLQARGVPDIVLGSHRWPLLIALAVSVAPHVVGVLVAGPLLTYDSASYVAAAESIAEGEGVMAMDGGPLTLFPPGWSVVAAMFMALGVAQMPAVAAAAITCSAALLIAVYVVARLSGGTPVLCAAATVLVGWLPVMTGGLGRYAGSDVLFAGLAVAAIAVSWHAGRTGSLRWVVTAGVLAGATVLVRWVGAPLLAVYLVWAVLPSRDAHTARRVRAGMVFVGASAVPPLLWIARNASTGRPPLGERPVAVTGLAENAVESLVGMLSALLPLSGGTVVAVIALFGFVVTLTALASGVLANPVRPGWLSLPAACASFAIASWFVIVVSSSKAAVDALGPRMVLPSVIALVMTGVTLSPWIRDSNARRALGTGLAVWLSACVISAGIQVTRAESWISQTAHIEAAVAEVPAEAYLMSNVPAQVRLATGHPTEQALTRFQYRGTKPLPELERLRELVKEAGEVWLVYTPTSPGAHLPPARLSEHGLNPQRVGVFPAHQEPQAELWVVRP